MIIRATAKIKITATPEIVQTIKVYKKTLQFCVNFAWKNKIRNKIDLQYAVYGNLRKRGLQAQLAVCCCRQAIEMIRNAESKPVIDQCSIRYNFPRSASFKGNVLSISTIKGRIKIPFAVPDCYKEYFTWTVCESLLRINKHGRCFFLFTFEKDVPERTANGVLGIDLGINHLAVTSDNRFFGSAKVKSMKRKFKHLRSKLQAKGTRSAQKLLVKLSGREKRFMAWINHNISKEIVAPFTGNKIVLEDLKGIRKVRRGKRMNYWISNWSFYQLQSFIQYKAERLGIKVFKVKPNYTSQICHRCGHLGSRSFGRFDCFHCGLSKFSADLNAGRNLAHPMLAERQAAVTQPYIQSDDVKGDYCATATELMDKSPAL